MAFKARESPVITADHLLQDVSASEQKTNGRVTAGSLLLLEYVSQAGRNGFELQASKQGSIHGLSSLCEVRRLDWPPGLALPTTTAAGLFPPSLDSSPTAHAGGPRVPVLWKERRVPAHTQSEEKGSASILLHGVTCITYSISLYKLTLYATCSEMSEPRPPQKPSKPPEAGSLERCPIKANSAGVESALPSHSCQPRLPSLG